MSVQGIAELVRRIAQLVRRIAPLVRRIAQPARRLARLGRRLDRGVLGPTMAVLLLAGSARAGAFEEDCSRLLASLEAEASPALELTVERLRRCREQAMRFADRSAEQLAVQRLAELQLQLGEEAESLKNARRALALALELGDVEAQRRAWTAVGDAAFYASDRPTFALHAFERARRLALARPGLEPHLVARTIVDVALTQAALGRRDLAMIELERALDTDPGWREDDLGVTVLGNLGTIYFRLGAPRAARRSLESALELAEARGREDEVADVLSRMAHQDLWRGRFESAAALFDRALEAARRSEAADEFFVAEGAAGAYLRTGRLDEAHDLMQRVVAAKRRRGVSPTSLCVSTLMLGRVREEIDPELAHRTYLDVDVRGRADARCRWNRLADLARVEAGWGELDRPIDRLTEALELLEVEREREVSRRAANELARLADPLARSLVRVLVARSRGPDARTRRDVARRQSSAGETVDDLERAYGVLERFRAPSLVAGIAEEDAEEVAEENADVNDVELPAAPAGRVEALDWEIRWTRSRLAGGDASESEASRLRAELARLEAERDEHLRVARRLARRSAPAAPVDLEEARALLGEGRRFVAFQVDEDQTLVFVVSAAGLEVTQLPAGRSELEARVEGFLDLLAQPEHDGWRTVGEALYRDLVFPWRGALTGASDGDGASILLISADGPLHSLPFAALPVPDTDRVLLDETALTMVPSLTALAQVRRPRGRRPEKREAAALIVGDPDLDASFAASPAGERRGLHALFEEDGHRLDPVPFGRREATRVHRLVGEGSELRLGASAGEAAIKELDLGRFSILHFATHGLLSPLDLGRSAVLLGGDPQHAEDGFLQAREVELFDLNAELVVLSACQTARGRALAGEGLGSLAQSFLDAGARSVVGTLWNVDDRASMELMTGFYRALADGFPKAEALRRAQLAARAGGATPLEWAGYTLLGEPEGRVDVARPRWSRRRLLLASLVVLLGVVLFVTRRHVSRRRFPSGFERRRHERLRPGSSL